MIFVFFNGRPGVCCEVVKEIGKTQIFVINFVFNEIKMDIFFYGSKDLRIVKSTWNYLGRDHSRDLVSGKYVPSIDNGEMSTI